MARYLDLSVQPVATLPEAPVVGEGMFPRRDVFRYSTIPALPTDHYLRLNVLDQHEYFGEDFRRGNMSAALFRAPSGRHLVLWTSGDIASFGMEIGSYYTLEHTQHRGKKGDLRLIALIYNDTDVSGFTTNPVSQWTMK